MVEQCRSFRTITSKQHCKPHILPKNLKFGQVSTQYCFQQDFQKSNKKLSKCDAVNRFDSVHTSTTVLFTCNIYLCSPPFVSPVCCSWSCPVPSCSTTTSTRLLWPSAHTQLTPPSRRTPHTQRTPLTHLWPPTLPLTLSTQLSRS